MKNHICIRTACWLALGAGIVVGAATGCAGAHDEEWQEEPLGELDQALGKKPFGHAPNTVDCSDPAVRENCGECMEDPGPLDGECCNPYLDIMGFPCQVINKATARRQHLSPRVDGELSDLPRGSRDSELSNQELFR